jgi:GNAT superfamily N-acetyltransferase
MPEFTLRAAQASDESAILDMARVEMEEQAGVDGRMTLRPDAAARYAVYLRDRMRDFDSAVFVAVDGKRVLGLVVASVRVQESFFVQRRFGYVSDLLVDPTARRGGIGRALWEKARQWFRALGVEVVRLHVAAKSETARAFWAGVGGEDFLIERWIDLGDGGNAEEKS